MMKRFGGTILATRFIVYMYCAMLFPCVKKEGGIIRYAAPIANCADLKQ